MRFKHKALILAFLVLMWGASRSSFAGGDQYDPPDLPLATLLAEPPYPNDPPDFLTVLQGLLSPTPVMYETRSPPEDIDDPVAPPRIRSLRSDGIRSILGALPVREPLRHFPDCSAGCVAFAVSHHGAFRTSGGER